MNESIVIHREYLAAIPSVWSAEQPPENPPSSSELLKLQYYRSLMDSLGTDQRNECE